MNMQIIVRSILVQRSPTLSLFLYSPQTQFYKLSRLLHDYHEPLYDCLEELSITPTLYAAAWFLTIFASHFPVGFVARAMGEYNTSVSDSTCHL